MKETVISVPAMYADHHVLRVREALLASSGVTEVHASAARKKVFVKYDETTTNDEALREALETAGYGPDQAPESRQFPERHKDGSAWYAIIQRTTTTERKDREMAGDFRRY